MYGPPNLGTHILSNKPVKEDYSGTRDEKSGMSEGIGSIIYNRDDSKQSYEGKFVWNNMHGYGEYCWQPSKYKYEGQFYVNKKEGYGRFSHPSGAYFEGLYRNDQRFGPGIYTDAAGYQDVGIWVASRLIRLSRTFESNTTMPRLAIRDEDKIRILRYRQIIHLEKEKIKHVAENLLESLTHLRNYDKGVLARDRELYNALCRDDRAPSFNKPRYDETFFGNESNQLTMDVLMTEEEIEEKIAGEKIEAIELEGSPSNVIPQSKESKIIEETYDLQARIEERYTSEISQQNNNLEIFEDTDEKKEEEPDYCGIKTIDLENMSDTLLTGNHEDQWNIFKSSAAIVPQEFHAGSNGSSSNDHKDSKDSGKPESSEEEFDNFGKKKIKDMRLTKKVVITDLMAWNNTPILIELLKHVFKHRNFENKLSFDISKVLAGRRGSFRQEGTHEKAALELLEACACGFQDKILRLISRHNLDVDVADSRGNTGLLLAAARDRIEVIDTLLNLGANVDSINDECLTPLSLCILRLLDLVHSVTDWSKAFLPARMIDGPLIHNESALLKKFEQWHGRVSYESLVQQLPKQMDRNPLPIKEDSKIDSKDFPVEDESAIVKDARNAESGNITNRVIKLKVQAEHGVTQKLVQHPDSDNQRTMQCQKYIFDMSPILGSCEPWKKFQNNKSRNRKVKTTTSKNLRDKNTSSRKLELKDTQDISNSEVSAKKERICATISKLLRRGADSNFAQVPYPAIIMAIFTKMPALVSELLEHGADPDTVLSKADHSLTPLLILAVLQPAYEHAVMAKALLKAKADPSIRADPEYRSDLTERLQRNRLSEFLEDSQGITALHLLAIRPDMDSDVNEYLGELIGVIYQHGCIRSSDLYQGHSPLSLAIVEGNLTAVKAFLKTTFVNVNEQLGANLGNAMLMLESCVLQELLPPDLVQELLELLIEYGGCPFVSARVLEEEYNQIEYGRKELMKMSNPPAENIVELKEKKKKSKSKGSKNSKPPDTRNFVKSMDFIEKTGKEKLIQRIQESFVRDLMDSPIMLLSVEKRSALLKESTFRDALTWMTGEDLAIVMKTMDCNRSSIRELVRLFVMACITARQTTLSEIDTLIRNETERIMNKVMPLIDQKNSVTADFKIKRNVSKGEPKKFAPTEACAPQSDLEGDRFKVCFECLAVHGKVLILCPKCKRVYFCSQECNAKCVTQEGNLHQCPVFYQKEWNRLEKIATALGFDAKSYMLERFNDFETYIDLEKSSGRSMEPRGKRSLKNQDYNTDSNTPKCKYQDTTNYERRGTDGVIDELRNQRKDGEQKRNGKIKTEDDDGIKSNKQKTGRIFDMRGEMNGVSATKSMKIKQQQLFKNKKGLGLNIKLKYTAVSDMMDTASDEREPSNKISSKKGRKNTSGIDNDKDEEVSDSDIKVKARKKNNIESVDGNKTKSKKKKNGNKLQDDIGDGTKLKKGKKKGSEFGENEDKNDAKFKNEGNRWKAKRGEQRSNDLYKNKDNRLKKLEVKHNKQEYKNEINKKTREGHSNAPNEKYKNNGCYVETNIPEKYLDWLLKVSRSAGENLDIDMLLLPYVVFAQGDTYFRIVPANQYPKFAGNYSLI